MGATGQGGPQPTHTQPTPSMTRTSMGILLALWAPATGELRSVWTPDLGLTLVATCTGPNASECPLGMSCGSIPGRPGECGPTRSPASKTCFACTYGGTNDCKFACPEGTSPSSSCTRP